MAALSSPGPPGSADSRDLPPLDIFAATEPRQIDLIGDRTFEVLIAAAGVPAGTYRELSARLTSAPTESAAEPDPQNPCGDTQRNSIVMSNGPVDPLRLADNPSEPRMAFFLGGFQPSSLGCREIPGSICTLHSNYSPSISYDAEALKLQNALRAKAEVQQQPYLEPERFFVTWRRQLLWIVPGPRILKFVSLRARGVLNYFFFGG